MCISENQSGTIPPPCLFCVQKPFIFQTDNVGNGLGGRGWLVLGDNGSLDIRVFNSFDCPNCFFFKEGFF